MTLRAYPLLLVAVAGLLAGPLPLAATSVVLGADADLADQAAVTVEATVLVRLPAPLTRGLPSTDYQLRVERILKGRLAADTLRLRVLGGPGPGGLTLKIWGAPALRDGERLLLFLVPPKDGAGGAYRPLHLAVGVFHLAAGQGGQRLAVRDLSEMELVERGGNSFTPGDVQVRDFDRFAQWLADRAGGVVRAPDYQVELPAAALDQVREKFTYLDNLQQRWVQFDSGAEVHWTMSQAGQPGLDDGGFNEFQVAINAWNANPGTNIKYRYDGTSTYSGGFQHADGQNTLLTEDPNDDLPGSFVCSAPGIGVGILAAGGTWLPANTPPPVPIREADIVTQDGVGCWFNHDAALAEQVFAHELGHSLGLGHSCGDALSGPCDTTAKSDALMRATAHNDNRGASIRQDDMAGILTLYPSGPGGGPGGPPAAPSQLTATALSSASIDLAWKNGSAGASEIDVESEPPGGSFQQIQALPGSATAATVSDLAPAATYSFRVRARNGFGASAYTNVASATTRANPVPRAPADLTATPQPGGHMLLSWQPGSQDAASFRIDQSSPLGDFAPIATVPGSSTSYTVTGLTAGTPYSFRVLAQGSSGMSPPSNLASATGEASRRASNCAGAADTLCLVRGRFQVKVQWRNDANGEHGSGQAIPSSDQTGMFWFFAPTGVDVIVKVLDGRPLNGFFWTFYGSLSSVEYWVTVADTLTGRAQTYLNPSGKLCGGADTTSLPAGDLAAAEVAPAVSRIEVPADRPPLPPPPPLPPLPPLPDDERLAAAATGCAGPPGDLCLLGGRFQVAVSWTNTANGKTGTGVAVPLSGQTGLFWFFDAGDIELVVKMIDGRPVNGKFWFYYGALSNVQYDVRVTDTTDGAVRTYHNAAGNLCGVGDTKAF